MAESKFETWFIAQHGMRKAPELRTLSDEDLITSIQCAKTAKQELQRRKQWDARWESALYAWQARENV
jgi:hypothetical protein